ncbi:MAG: phosphatidylserine decarboxylase, partial [Gammaproteobacteria bacterium]|nr:phosphatidylserine decarboxylase [Gammaproteobacteria bacterium]
MNSEKITLSDYLKTLPQYLLPQHFISRVTLWLTRCKTTWFKNAFIHWFIRQYHVDMSQALEPIPEKYPHFNAFFTRALRSGVRPLASGEHAIACPADGAVSQLGNIDDDHVFQAKGHHYSLTELLGGSADRAAPFRNGRFATLYLSPRDYHRMHMPLSGTLREMVYVPGRLFAVNRATVKVIPRVFARNERVVAIFDTPIGQMGLVLVGAINVGCIETVWHGVVTPPALPDIKTWLYGNVNLARGAEMGRFNMGSTVVV